MNAQGLKMQREYVAEVVADDMETWNKDGNTPKFDDPWKYVFYRFGTECNNKYNKTVHPNIIDRMASWLQGLPMSFEFENYKILELARKWDYINGHLKCIEGAEDRFLDNWWRCIANDICFLAKKTVDVESYR